MKKLALAMVLLMSGAAWAGPAEETSALLKKTVDGVLASIRDKSLSRQAKKDRVMKQVSPVFDFSLMAKLTLGRTYWPKLDEAQKERFTDLFIKQLQSSYLDKVDLVRNEKVTYTKPVVSADNKVLIVTNVLHNNENIRLAYRFYKTGEDWKVYDVEIQDISIVKSYGAQYQQVLKTGTVQDLLAQMEQKIKQLEAESAQKKQKQPAKTAP